MACLIAEHDTSESVEDALRGYAVISEKEFKPRLGRIGHEKSARPKPLVREVLDVAYKSGFKAKRTSSFTAQRIGRGAAWGTLASAGLMGGGSRSDLLGDFRAS